MTKVYKVLLHCNTSSINAFHRWEYNMKVYGLCLMSATKKKEEILCGYRTAFFPFKNLKEGSSMADLPLV